MSSNRQGNPFKKFVSSIGAKFNRKRPNDSQSSDEVNEPSLMFGDVTLPPEIIERILCFADERTLLNCRRVCKDWNDSIVNYVLRKRAEMKMGCKFTSNAALGFKNLYLICTKNLFNRNLIKNHSGEEDFKYWHIIQNGGHRWQVQRPASDYGVPTLPDEPEFGTGQHGFATSFSICLKQYHIDLIEEGFPEYVLDQMQLSIEVCSTQMFVY